MDSNVVNFGARRQAQITDQQIQAIRIKEARLASTTKKARAIKRADEVRLAARAAL